MFGVLALLNGEISFMLSIYQNGSQSVTLSLSHSPLEETIGSFNFRGRAIYVGYGCKLSAVNLSDNVVAIQVSNLSEE